MPPRKTTTRIVAAAAITALLLPAGALAQAHAPPPRARAAPQRFKSQTPPADIPAPQKAPPQPSAAEQTPPAAKPPPATEAPCDEAALDARLAEVLDELATIEANIAAYKAANDELERKIGVERGRMKSKTTLLGAVRSEVAAARKRGRDASALTASLETEARQVEAELQELEAVHADVREILNMESHHRLLTGQVSEEAKTRMAQLKETLAEAKAAALKDETNLQVQTGLKKDKEEAAAKSYMTCDGEVAQLEQQGAEGASEEVQQKLYKVFKKRDAAAARLDAARTAYSAVFSKAREVARRQMPAQAPGAGALGRARDVLAAGVLKVERLLVDAIGLQRYLPPMQLRQLAVAVLLTPLVIVVLTLVGAVGATSRPETTTRAQPARPAVRTKTVPRRTTGSGAPTSDDEGFATPVAASPAESPAKPASAKKKAAVRGGVKSPARGGVKSPARGGVKSPGRRARAAAGAERPVSPARAVSPRRNTRRKKE